METRRFRASAGRERGSHDELRGKAGVWTFRNMTALGLFLFGTTFLWMTPAFAGETPPPTGIAWTLVNLLALVAVVGFTVTAWALYKGRAWWTAAALPSALVGLIAAVPYVVGLTQIDVGLADLGVEINLWLHVAGSAMAIAIVRVPAVRGRVVRRL